MNIFKKDKELFISIAWFLVLVAVFDFIRSAPFAIYLVVPAVFFGVLIWFASMIGKKAEKKEDKDAFFRKKDF